MVRIPSSGYVKMHGSGVAGCSSWPNIGFAFNITFTRNASDHSKLDFQMSGLSIDPNGSHSGIFGYNFIAAIGFSNAPDAPDNDDDIWWIANKSASVSSNWWNNLNLNNRSGTFPCEANTTVVKLYVRAYHDGYECCYNNNAGRYCYNNGHRFYKVYTSDPISVPPYEEHYTVSYNANGGSNPPPSQQKSSLSDLTLTSQVPVYHVTINYFNSGDVTPSDVVNVNRQFSSWNTSADGSGTSYASGGTFSTNANTVLYAQWGNASFIPIAIPNQFVTVTYDPNDGVVSPTSTLVPRAKEGYNTGSGTATAYYPGTSATTTTDLDLYPVYGVATLAVTDMPTPTREGYRFSGWYRDPELTDKIITSLTTSTDITIYARWTKLPINQFDINGEWKGNAQYVWQMKAASGSDPRGWYKTAPIYGFDGVAWVDLSEGIQPKGIFNAMGVVGLLPEFAEGVEYAKQQSGTDQWQITQDKIYVPYTHNTRMTLGGQLRKSFYKYICIEADASGIARQWNRSEFGIRYISNGKGGTSSDNVANNYIAFTYYVPTGWGQNMGYNYLDPTTRAENVEPYWYYLPKMVTKLDLSAVTQEPFYLTMHACDCGVNIYRIWLE